MAVHVSSRVSPRWAGKIVGRRALRGFGVSMPVAVDRRVGSGACSMVSFNVTDRQRVSVSRRGPRRIRIFLHAGGR